MVEVLAHEGQKERERGGAETGMQGRGPGPRTMAVRQQDSVCYAPRATRACT